MFTFFSCLSLPGKKCKQTTVWFSCTYRLFDDGWCESILMSCFHISHSPNFLRSPTVPCWHLSAELGAGCLASVLVNPRHATESWELSPLTVTRLRITLTTEAVSLPHCCLPLSVSQVRCQWRSLRGKCPETRKRLDKLVSFNEGLLSVKNSNDVFLGK